MPATNEEHLSDRLTRIEVSLWGVDGSNGMRGDVRELAKKVSNLLVAAWALVGTLLIVAGTIAAAIIAAH